MASFADTLKRSGLSVATLNKRTKLPSERIEQLLKGETPSMAEIRAIVDALKIRVEDLREMTGTAERSLQLLFRSAAVGGKDVPEQAREALSRRVANPMSLLKDGMTVTALASDFKRGTGHAEWNAQQFRRLFCQNDQLSPLLSLPRVAVDASGVVLIIIRNNSVDGASGFFDGIPFVVVSSRFPARMLFTLAHELGHLVAHHDPSQPSALIDQETEIDAPQATSSATAIERDANEFASALLLPAQAVGIALKAIREQGGTAKSADLGDVEINYLARFFGVSFWTAALRCEALSLLPRGGAYALYQEIKDTSGTPEKRADEAGLPPRAKIDFSVISPALLASAVRQVRDGELSIGRAAELVGSSISDVVNANASALA